MKNIVSVSFVFIFGIFFSACSPNTRIFYIDNIACSASNEDTGEWSYYWIEIGTPNKPYKGKPAIDISVPGVSEFKTSTISIEEIRKITGAKVSDMPAIESTPQVGLWPKSVRQIDCGPYLSFVVSNNKILQIIIVHKGKIRRSGNSKWYELPLKEKDIIELFGKPEKTYEWFRE